MQFNNVSLIATAQRMKFDDLAWDRSDDVAKAWKMRSLMKRSSEKLGGP
jgi:hypothetical protein